MSTDIKLFIESVVKSAFLAEGVMDKETTEISRMVVSAIKDQYFTGLKPKKKAWKFQWQVDNKPLSVAVNAFLYPNLNGIKMMGGEYQVARYKTQPTTKTKHPALPPDQLSLNIGLPADGSKIQTNQLESFVFELKSVIRHELEHGRQKARGFKTASGSSTDPWSQDAEPSKVFTDPATALAYYSSPDEVEAYVMQIYRTAKMKKIPFEQAMKEYITGTMGQQMLKGMGVGQGIKTLNTIKKSWLDYAYKRLPSLFAK